MLAEIISIGDELTSGQRLDTNSQWISQQLGDLGVRTMFHSTVGDDLQSNIAVMKIAARRADLVIITGGLGPTADDLTREAFAAAFERPLELYPEAMAHIEALFARRARPMPERNRVQAFFPKGSRIIPNPHGSAPGIDLTIIQDNHSCRLIALPGVPAEAKQMWEQTVRVRLMEELGIGQRRWFYKSLRCFGIGESDVEARVPDLISRDRFPRVGITVSRATITLRIAAEAESEEAFARLIGPTEEEIHSNLADVLYGEADEELEHVVTRELTLRNQSLSVIELGAESLIPSWMLHAERTHSTASSGCFRSSLLLRGEQNLRQWLEAFEVEGDSGSIQFAASFKNVEAEEKAETSRLVAAAIHFKLITNTDWCLAVGPYPELAEVESTGALTAFPFAIIVVDPHNQVVMRNLRLGGHPDLINHRLGRTGLQLLLKVSAGSEF